MKRDTIAVWVVIHCTGNQPGVHKSTQLANVAKKERERAMFLFLNMFKPHPKMLTEPRMYNAADLPLLEHSRV